MRKSLHRQGFTLIELLVVIAIIAVLIALLLPAVQAAREAARRSQCINNLKQLALAAQNYHDTNLSFPSQVGNPATSGASSGSTFSTDSRVSWLLEILPHMEQPALFNAYNFIIPDAWASTINSTVYKSTVNTFICPSYPGAPSISNQAAYSGSPTQVAFAAVTPAVFFGASCYAGNGGDNLAGATGTYSFAGVTGGGQLNALGYPNAGALSPTARGMFWLGTMQVNMASVSDGTSNTILVGERLPNISYYFQWTDSFQSVGYTTVPSNAIPSNTPINSTLVNSENSWGFRSLHNGGSNFGFVDGSVHFVKGSVSPAAFNALGSRAGGEMINADAY